MAASSSFLLVIIMLALLCHTQAGFTGNRLSKKGDLVSQAKIQAQQSIAAAQTAAGVAKKYDSGSTKAKAETCMETCGDAIDLMKQCLNVLNSFDRSRMQISDLQTWGSAALTNVDTCDDEFGSGEPADLKQASVNAQNNIRNFLITVNSM